MIIPQIIGGLGNQMFQYAAARGLAESLRQPIALDIDAFSNYQQHNGFELFRVFSMQQALATKTHLKSVLGWQAIPFFRKVLARPKLSILRNKNFIVEPHFQYWDGLKHVPSDAYMVGYWQSDKYFESIETIIREDFIFKQQMSPINQKIADQIVNCNAVSLHVRRGDYLHNPTALAIHGLCSLDYYRDAIQYIKNNVSNPNFYIFSDDIAWVRNELDVDDHFTFVNNNSGSESYNDMRLISLCKHNIIANSSFSWWGAWLNCNQNKIVVAPKKWFVDKTKVTADLYLSDWVLI